MLRFFCAACQVLLLFVSCFLHFLQPFHAPTSISLLIPLQTVLPAILLHSSSILPRSFIFCHLSTLQPWYHRSPPRKLSWSEPHRPFLSVGLQRFPFLPGLTLCYGFCTGCKVLLFLVFISNFYFFFSNPSTLQPWYHCSSPCKLSCLQSSYVPPRSFIFCHLSTPRPRSHCSSPCKLSGSEPHRPLLSVGLRNLIFFKSAWFCVTVFLHRLPGFAILRFVSPSFFATRPHSNLNITAHPLANCLGLNHNGDCSPLTFGSLFFFHLLDSVSSIPFGFLAYLFGNFLFLPRFPPFSTMPHLCFMPFLHFPLHFFLPFSFHF